MPTGIVKFFNENKGYGFIQPEGGGSDAFVHITAVERAGMRSLRQDQRISYDLQQDNRGKMSAVNLGRRDWRERSASRIGLSGPVIRTSSLEFFRARAAEGHGQRKQALPASVEQH